jgi:hypothetical protein
MENGDDMHTIRRKKYRSLAVVVALMTSLTLLQFGRGATPAFAGVIQHCSPPGDIKKFSFGEGTLDLWMVCAESKFTGVSRDPIWDWFFWSTKIEGQEAEPARARQTLTDSSYTMLLGNMLADGEGGGYGAGRIRLLTPQGQLLNRRLRVSVDIQINRTGAWEPCRSTGWVESAGETSKLSAFFNMHREPDCGNGTYRARSYGRFFSISLNQWVQRGPIISPSKALPGV